VTGDLEQCRALCFVRVDGAEGLLDGVRPASGDQAAYLTLFTPHRFDLEPGVGAEVEAVRNPGGHLAVHWPMVTVMPCSRRGGGMPRRPRGPGISEGSQRGSPRYAS
jgi:hypothetical protein